MKLLFTNVKAIHGITEPTIEKLSGAEMAKAETIEKGYLLVEDGKIADFGRMVDMKPTVLGSVNEVIDAQGRLLLPAFCDSHTHIVFAEPREAEFVDRINGLSYEEIAQRGGGILNSAKKMREYLPQDLYDSAKSRIDEMMLTGTGAVEIKSGYGLSLAQELKMLRVIKELKNHSPITIKATFLGAHAIPTAYKEKREEYIESIIHEMIPAVVAEELADYIDVFCDKGFFTPEETDRILKAGIAAGLQPKIHANELAISGGVQVGVANNALSVDHLECMSDAEIEVLKNSDTMATMLPGTAFFLKISYPPARKMIDAGLAVALASDYNPGSSPSGNMEFITSLACIQMNMLPQEALTAATLNGAYAMDLGKEMGSIAIGKRANLILTRPIPSLAFLPYNFGSSIVERLFIDGEMRVDKRGNSGLLSE
ncbi:MAG: imidazolonepropionase [Schleiferiaceae bacterium]|nr:imidazolonepropionase [Schleiferiaceae bacterium]